MLYAVIDPDGNVQDVVPTAEAAVQEAARYSAYVLLEEVPAQAGALGDAGAGLGDLGRVNLNHPQVALRMSGLKPTRLDMRMPLDVAWEALYPYFPKERFVKTRKGVLVNQMAPVKAYDSPSKMAGKLLGQNYKTAKVDADYGLTTNVKGLSLVPAQTLKGVVPGFNKVHNCVGASRACIGGCLVYSGHNEIDRYNIAVKQARMIALHREPAAFMRMLAENIKRHAQIRKGVPFIRLNVFSDLPWELICPDLFTQFPDVRFYDYTKVANRTPPANYDLTFSFSGENQQAVAHELGRDRRIAVVFVPPRAIPAKNRERGEGLPPKFNVADFGSSLGALPVVDGDVSDVRPFDPPNAAPGGELPGGPCIVGLRWKIPMGRQEEAFAQAREASFAVPVIEMDGHLIASTSARLEPIRDADDEDEDAGEDE